MEHRSPKRILCMLAEPGAGDALRISFCLQAVRESYPSAEIVLLVRQDAAGVFKRSQLSKLFDRVVVSRLYPQTGPSALRLHLKQARELVRLVLELGVGYDLVIVFWWGTTLLNVLARLVGRRSIGYAHRFPSLLSCDLGSPWERTTDPVEQNRALLAPAGVRPALVVAPPTIHTTEDEAAVQRLLEEYRLGFATTLMVLHPGSDWACQQWLPERWAALADRLAADYGADVVFTGTDSERAYVDGIRALMRASSTSLVGRTTLSQLGALVTRAQFCVCVDSVVYELTQAAGTPAVVLAGPSEPDNTPTGLHPPIIVNRTTAELKMAINNCRVTKAWTEGGCRNYACSMAGLQHITVADALAAIERQGVLDRARRLAVAQGVR